GYPQSHRPRSAHDPAGHRGVTGHRQPGGPALARGPPFGPYRRPVPDPGRDRHPARHPADRLAVHPLLRNQRRNLQTECFLGRRHRTGRRCRGLPHGDFPRSTWRGQRRPVGGQRSPRPGQDHPVDQNNRSAGTSGGDSRLHNLRHWPAERLLDRVDHRRRGDCVPHPAKRPDVRAGHRGVLHRGGHLHHAQHAAGHDLPKPGHQNAKGRGPM
ncbi:ABC transporter, substrate-binding protein (cluster 3, basic aa/glutamine/opines) / ABC transporter, permease protein (cluster 3, basic aa/glutamine/opines), partial [Arthrobacter sp. DR-2P]